MSQQDGEKPNPLVPSDVDLRGYDFMPLYGDRLFHSVTWITATAEAKVAMLTLWWHAYAREVPAASLPNDDRLLAQYAGYGAAPKAWKRIKAEAMRGWTLCADGRLYHKVLAAIALDAWSQRKEYRNGRERQDRHRRERSELFECLRSKGVTPPFNIPISELREMAARYGCAVPSETGDAVTSDVTRDAHATARSEGKRSDSDIKNRDVVLNPDIPREQTPAPDPPNGKSAIEKIEGRRSLGQDWSSPAWVAATAITVGVTRRIGESESDFKDRTYAAVEQRRRASQH